MRIELGESKEAVTLITDHIKKRKTCKWTKTIINLEQL